MFNSSKAELKKVQEDLEYTSNLLEDLKLENAQLKRENMDYRQTIAAYPLAKQSYESEMDELNKKHKSKVDVLEQQLSEMEQSVNAKVNNALACIGVSQFVIEQVQTNTISSPKEHLNKFQSLEGDDKTKYYRKYKTEIDRAVLEH